MKRSTARKLPTAARVVVLGLLSLIAAHSPAARASTIAQTLAETNQALQAGEADRALGFLSSLPQSGTQSAEAQNLECRVRYTLEQWDTAVNVCQQSVRLEGQNSNYHLWLARALGGKADHATFMTAYSLAKLVRAEFEAAVNLDPHSAQALFDLGAFYKEAPGVVGGGLDKADGIAARLDTIDPSRAHELRARIADGRDDVDTAEREFRLSITTAAHPADEWTSLASFYRKHHRWQDLDAAIRSCQSAALRDSHSGVALYDAAGVLIEAKRNPELAATLLEDYVAGTSKSEEAPAFEALVRLARLKKQLGDSNGAQREIAAALALAHDYKPALDFKP